MTARLSRQDARRIAVRAQLLDATRPTDVLETVRHLTLLQNDPTKRRWGYWTMPILYGDRLVGKLDATADRDRGVLRVDAAHRDVPFSAALAMAVDREIAGLARWLGLDLDPASGR